MLLLLPASVTLADAVDAKRLLTQALLSGGPPGAPVAPVVVVDATHLRRFDSSALSVLLACQRVATGQGKGFSVRGAPAPLVTLAALYGVDAVLPFSGLAPTAAIA